MEPLDDRSKDLVIDLLLLACVKSAGQAARPTARDALRALSATFPADGSLDLTTAWDCLQAEAGVARDAASDGCAYVKSLEARLGVTIRAPLASVGRTAAARLLSDGELERFLTAAAIRPARPGTRSLPGITKHLVGGHSVAPSVARVNSGASPGPTRELAAVPPPEETTDVRERKALAKLDAIYEGTSTRASGQIAAQSGKPGGPRPAPRPSATRPAMRASGMVAIPVATPAQRARRAVQKKIAAIVLSVAAVALFAFLLVPSLRDESVAPTVLAPTLLAPLQVSDLKVLGPDAIATLVDAQAWGAAPEATRTRELEAAFAKLAPHHVARLTLRAGTKIAASVHRSAAGIVVRYGR